MTKPAKSKRHPGLLLTTLTLGSLACATALGAAASMTDCEDTAELQSLDVPVSELSSPVIGHIAAEAGEGIQQSVDALPVQRESSAPSLYLTPRIAVILQSVFSAVAIQPPLSDVDDSQVSADRPANSQAESPAAPVAGGDAPQSDSAVLPGLTPDSLEPDTVPSYQQKMFRTDI